MKRFSVSDARNNLPMLIEKAKKEPIMIERHGKEEAVLISAEQFERFVEAEEELEDIKAIEASMKDPGPNIPWEKVKKELGLS
jgi:prevent-host-death family protein